MKQAGDFKGAADVTDFLPSGNGDPRIDPRGEGSLENVFYQWAAMEISKQLLSGSEAAAVP